MLSSCLEVMGCLAQQVAKHCKILAVTLYGCKKRCKKRFLFSLIRTKPIASVRVRCSPRIHPAC